VWKVRETLYEVQFAPRANVAPNVTANIGSTDMTIISLLHGLQRTRTSRLCTAELPSTPLHLPNALPTSSYESFYFRNVSHCQLRLKLTVKYETSRGRISLLIVAFSKKIVIFCAIAPRSTFMTRRFGGNYHLLLPSHLAITLNLCSDDFRPWKWWWYIPSKRQLVYELHGALSQAIATFITTAERISNITRGFFCRQKHF
jgi:hypothetical protein